MKDTTGRLVFFVKSNMQTVDTDLKYALIEIILNLHTQLSYTIRNLGRYGMVHLDLSRNLDISYDIVLASSLVCTTLPTILLTTFTHYDPSLLLTSP